MSFMPHTQADVEAMLAEIGESNLQALFDEIPESLRVEEELKLPTSMNEMQVTRLAKQHALRDAGYQCFIGAGAYEHHSPAAVWDLVSRGEYYTAYTPYQAEASQGGLQLIYEYQTMMTSLTGLDVSNASLYDGANALAEAILMAVRCNKKNKTNKILVLGGLHPFYKETVETIVQHQGITLKIVAYDQTSGRTSLESLDQASKDAVALVIQQPNFFGSLETVDALTDWAHANNQLVIAVCNPTSLALLKEPGAWGEQGVDIACGEGQPLGLPLASGGPYFGFLTCKMALVRQMPGRIIGRTVDQDGKQGFTLTLQAREQHIRRAKAKSNVCTNQGLMVVAATIYMSLLGPEGLKQTAIASHQNTQYLVERLLQLEGVEQVFDAPFFHETVLRFEQPVSQILKACEQQGLLAGLDLSATHPELENTLLVCATETKTKEELDNYIAIMQAALIKCAAKEEVTA
jgi:glycine dehydrogenase subunit 1